MKNRMVAILVLTVAAGGSAVAHANSKSARGSFEILGKRFCLASAPTHANCDYRLGASPSALSAATAHSPVAAQHPGEKRLRLWGKEYCFGACEHRSDGRSFELFGKRICLGHAADAGSCDLSFPNQPRKR